MKRNALTRIILWSIAIAVMAAILFGVLFGVNWNKYRIYEVSPPQETVVLVEVTTPTTDHQVTADAVNVRSSPSPEASAIAMLTAGENVGVSREETVNGIGWAYITTPVAGWVQSEYLGPITNRYQSSHAEEHRSETAPAAPSETEELRPSETVAAAAIPEAEEARGFDPSRIHEIEIEWMAGDILIQPMDIDTIQVSESGVSDSKYVMVCKQKEDKLSIKFSQETKLDWNFGINVTTDLKKDLTIYVPKDWTCETLEIDAAAASVEVKDLTIREVEFDGASGTCTFENCTVGQMELDTASGDIRYTGSLNSLNCDAASANVYAVFTNVPSRLSLDTMSGDLDITLPENAGFTVSMDAMSSSFSSDFETSMKNNNHVHGDGSCRIQVEGMSGDVIIRKGAGA